uniref:Alanine racemase (Fragments) n=1 Tax=Penaeus monodon TaxID=6687 RepID=ALR_PENMO|nr:RecName: Full=Alanine racemase [Penaeus monodon]
QPAFSVVTRPTFYKLLKAGRDIGYDGTYTTSEDEWIANFTTGWSDQLSRRLSTRLPRLYTRNGKIVRICPSLEYLFLEASEPFTSRGITRHVAATTGCVQDLGTDLDFIRPGGAITGLCS